MDTVRNEGFTLVELAIVMVIIGILLGTILKGQELVNNARVKRLLNDLKGLESVTWAFFDRYGRMPGDCNRDGVIDPVPGGLNNDPADGFCGSTYDGDQDRPWAELKTARFLSPTSDNRDLAKHIFSGTFNIARVWAGSGTSFVNSITASNVPCFAAKAIDVAIDGALDAGLGRIREVSGYTALSSSDAWSSCDSEDDTVNIVYFFDKLP